MKITKRPVKKGINHLVAVTLMLLSRIDFA